MGFVSVFILIGILYLANLPLQWLVTNALLLSYNMICILSDQLMRFFRF